MDVCVGGGTRAWDASHYILLLCLYIYVISLPGALCCKDWDRSYISRIPIHWVLDHTSPVCAGSVCTYHTGGRWRSAWVLGLPHTVSHAMCATRIKIYSGVHIAVRFSGACCRNLKKPGEVPPLSSSGGGAGEMSRVSLAPRPRRDGGSDVCE